MTRREFFSIAAAGVPGPAPRPLSVPIHHVLDRGAKWRPEQIGAFWSRLWPQAVHDFGSCGIRLETSLKTGDVWRPPGREPVISGLDPGVVNFVITDRIPMAWDQGLSLSGVTTRYRGRHLCMVALDHAHGHQIPLLSVNTCVHALLHDIFERRPDGLLGEARELRIDWYATRLWLFHDGAAIRRDAQAYVERLRSAAGPGSI